MEVLMLAKLVEGVIEPGSSVALAHAVDDELIPSFLEHDGASSGYWMSDRSSGRVVAITLWNDLDSLRAAASSDGAERSVIADRIALRVLSVQAMPVLAAQLLPSHAGGDSPRRSARVTWVEGAAASARPHLAQLYEEIVADQISSTGFAGSFWFGEERSGEGCAVSMWERPADLSGGTPASRRRQRRVARALGCRVSKVHEYEVIGVARRDPRSGPGHRTEQLSTLGAMSTR
jgi:hypothetical protein